MVKSILRKSSMRKTEGMNFGSPKTVEAKAPKPKTSKNVDLDPLELLDMRRSELAGLQGNKDSFSKTKEHLVADLSNGKVDMRPRDGGDPRIVKPF